ncbi:uncharacterized protein LOC143451521 [Clavelina lepadiformis]|uniref:uncharacterized protein LOC143451521 n=1 Tax=Clavelina lepadiformis TaxID=159417 RepID=UPI0040412F06
MKLTIFFTLLKIFLVACLALSEGFFLKNRKRDCTITPFGSWGKCKSVRGSYSQTRTRQLTQPRNGGKPCPKNTELFQTQSCSPPVPTTADLFFESFSGVFSAPSSVSVSPGNNRQLPPGTRVDVDISASGQQCLAIRVKSPNHQRSKRTLRPLDTSLLRPVDTSLLRPVDTSFARSLETSSLPLQETTDEEATDEEITDDWKLVAIGGCGGFGRKKRSVVLEDTLQRLRRQTLELRRDMIILMDKSGSIGSHMETVKDIAAGVVRAICNGIGVHLDRTRIAVATFENTYQVHFNFNQFDGSPGRGQINLESEIKNLRIRAWGGTHMVDAMNKALLTFKDTSRGARHGNSDVKKLLMLITDGCANGPGDLKRVRDKYVSEDIEIMVIFLNDDQDCKSIIKDLDTGHRCFEQFFLNSWQEGEEFVRDLYNHVRDESCPIPTWGELLNSC